MFRGNQRNLKVLERYKGVVNRIFLQKNSIQWVHDSTLEVVLVISEKTGKWTQRFQHVVILIELLSNQAGCYLNISRFEPSMEARSRFVSIPSGHDGANWISFFSSLMDSTISNPPFVRYSESFPELATSLFVSYDASF